MLVGLVTAWRLASWPTRRSPVFVKPTTDGTVRLPSADGMTVGSPPSMTATTLFVVPRSMPMILPMRGLSWSLVGVAGWVVMDQLVGPSGTSPAVGDGDERRPDDAVAEAVAAPDLVDDLALGPAGARDADDRLVLARIERPCPATPRSGVTPSLSRSWRSLRSMAAMPSAQPSPSSVGRAGVDRAVEVVGDDEHLADEVLAGEAERRARAPRPCGGGSS